MAFLASSRPSRAALIAVLALPLLAAAGRAQAPAAGPKIAVINTELILLNSQAGKAALGELKKRQEAKEAEGLAKNQELKDLQQRLSEGRLSLSDDRLAALEKEIEDKLISLRRFQDDANRELGKKRDELLAQIDGKVMPVINQIGQEMGFTLIFRKFESGLIYADASVDITPLVIQRMDAAQTAGGK